MNPLRLLLGLLSPRHKAVAAQCTTGAVVPTLEELDAKLGPVIECDACGDMTDIAWDEARAKGWSRATWHDGETITFCPECGNEGDDIE